MKATIERATLLKGLSHVQSVVERRNTIPILSNVLISADGQSMKLMATDLDLQIKAMKNAEEALDAAGIEIPFPHQVAVPYREDVVPLVQLKAVGPVDGDK